ncbi:restriction endonuclease subunit S [Exiguobacterium sp. 22311]|uniref:restriction endonuclease subunit S n=1 Tax=Exiguobacterium sp. 22311 TaxID=3453907 RepID=UPI003F3672CF
MKSNKPKIRFTDFNEPWINYNLKNIGEIKTGITPSTSDLENYSDKGMLWITPTDIKELITKESAKKLSLKGQGKARIVEPNTILVTSIASIGKNTMVESYASFNQQINSLTPFKSNDPYFLLTQSYFWSKDMKRKAASGMMQIVNKSEFSEMEFLIPNKNEQVKIGLFFKNLDDMIALHQQEFDALKKTKQGFLQKMFPENNKSKPTVHINGDNNNWTEYKMKTVFGKIKNAFVGTASPYYVTSGHFYLESNNIKDGKINRKTEIFINDEFYEKQKSNWLKTGDLVMVQSGHVGHTAVVPEELNNTAAHAVIVFSDTQLKVDSDFINYQLQTYSSKKRLHSLTTGNTIKHILASEMKNFLIQLPSYEEQQKISSIFKDLDDLIELKEQELEALKQTKKGFLQKMFV